MSTLGQKPATQHVSTEKQTITGNGGTSYTLQQSVSQASDIEVFVNNTRQEPTVAYTASGTTLTMTGAVNASDSFYVIFQGKAIQTAGLPVDAAITASTINLSQTLAVTGNTTVGGTLGVTGVQTNSSTITGTILKGTTSLQSPLIEFTDGDDAIAIANGGYVTNPNIPAFLTYGTPSITSVGSNHHYFHSFGNGGESFNNGNHYNNSSGKFTAPVAGRYAFGFSVWRAQTYSGGDQLIYINKNSYSSGGAYVGSNASGSQYDQLHVHLIYNMAVNDWVAPGLYYTGTFSIQASTPRNYFYGFLIG